MKIIRPYHHNLATKVENWPEIKDQALELRDFIKNGKFEGYYERAYAFSHAYVSNKPKDFFVINEDIPSKENRNDFLKKAFGHWCIINPKIIKEDVPAPFPDGCFFFPFRKPKKIERFYYIVAEYYIPFWFGTLRRKVVKLEGITAFIMQHEIEHSLGKDVYGGKKYTKKS